MGNFKDRLQKNPVLVDALLLTKFNDIQYREKKNPFMIHFPLRLRMLKYVSP